MKKLLTLLGLGLVLGGCAMGARMGAMTAPVTEETLISDQSVLRETIAVAEVSGGKETNPLWVSKVSNENFRQALEHSLTVHTMLIDEDSARFQLRAELTELKQPLVGFDMTVTAIVRYVLVDLATNVVLFDRLIETPYKAKFGDSLMANQRVRLANEGAVRRNIEEFILQLIAEADTNPEFRVADAGA